MEVKLQVSEMTQLGKVSPSLNALASASQVQELET